MLTNEMCAYPGIICEPSPFLHIYEEEVARRWYALPAGVSLPLDDGGTCQVVFTGLPGSAAGPDVRDAVLHFSWQAEGATTVGDVELHVRARDWYAHQHDSDVRYNNVVLHVVFICDMPAPALRQDGTILPMCSLYDLPAPPAQTAPPRLNRRVWPCQQAMPYRSHEDCTRLLQQAGMLRFEQKAHTFVELLHATESHDPFSADDVCLILALAEGLGYGRDRDFFRAAGRVLLGLARVPGEIPQPLGRAAYPTPLDSSRLTTLRKLVAQWRVNGAWPSLKKALLLEPEPLQVLRALFAEVGVARADILICNVVLPFASAVALIENDHSLAARAEQIYREHPGLSSNRITRAMSQQLHLSAEPEGACQQQGLHYIYQQTCREKHCAVCMMGRRNLL